MAFRLSALYRISFAALVALRFARDGPVVRVSRALVRCGLSLYALRSQSFRLVSRALVRCGLSLYALRSQSFRLESSVVCPIMLCVGSLLGLCTLWRALYVLYESSVNEKLLARESLLGFAYNFL